MDLTNAMHKMTLSTQAQEFQPSTSAPMMTPAANAQEFVPSYLSNSNTPALSPGSAPFTPSVNAHHPTSIQAAPQSFQEYHPSTEPAQQLAQVQEYHPSSASPSTNPGVPNTQPLQQQQHQPPQLAPQGLPMQQGQYQDPTMFPGDPMFDPTAMGFGAPQHADQGVLPGYIEAYQDRTRPIQPPLEPLPYMYTVGQLLMPHAAHKLRKTDSYFSSEDLRKELLSQRCALEFSAVSDPNLPLEVDNYHTLMPLEPMVNVSKVFALPTIAYRAVSSEDGQTHMLRRLVGYQLSESEAMNPVRAWQKVAHVGIAAVKEAFTTKEFGDSSLVFAGEFFPNATTLEQRYLSTVASRPFDEHILWDFTIQLTSAIRAAHASNLAVRCVRESKVLVTARQRLIVTGVGVQDVLAFDANPPVDMDEAKMLERVKQVYSADLYNTLRYLLSPSPASRRKSVHDLMPLIGSRYYKKIDREQATSAVLESELSKELYNGHLFRIMTKLMMVTDRPTKDPRFREGGERYMLKLFKHYVFHQVTKEGEPFLDLAHVVQCLAKLDAASPERVCLMSQDGKNIIVVTYADLHRSLHGAFQELVNAASSMA
ncbi:hypothetical protein PTSG_08847 [Salpingoeca rosetta]|uniref:Pan3 C-terminal knob domain-containing protein n=1 Tax=Salpingoeca rosetta (strain ATCC 50818 / BSB-021) TaxID=946362 RepID=F2UKV9_SALR5|nr:uncharacterized protein PTSG_08847 [Salpingoeca rosetta]EGD77758.1 hypothetical protein PTSG_08847 [Salpingoeca rosetta]|eukprot:XP_004990234.1 hypothetical protein PTSG_08847 [Salpingoeca rosetta]